MTRPPRPPLTREEVRAALGELYELANEWDGLIECEQDENGWPKGDSLEANMKRLITDVTSCTSFLMFNLLTCGMQAEPPVDFEDLEIQ
ncbi:hypothetical protein XI06_14205 [Bradyrhizobium sp. CCBAU 11434]|uniref:hypothetical protein n=1 Tax=Bradyrhizobium sp. CCBAU 11434 TaxID=1630885 RepID=UPI0023051CF8|nr:hypothetical protein [Bradyrhizobium sp. CCBAU 11434]MDA9521472.1 hypothetical protein [Bradyrhizobium sp. CCBAU 11434]